MNPLEKIYGTFNQCRASLHFIDKCLRTFIEESAHISTPGTSMTLIIELTRIRDIRMYLAAVQNEILGKISLSQSYVDPKAGEKDPVPDFMQNAFFVSADETQKSSLDIMKSLESFQRMLRDVQALIVEEDIDAYFQINGQAYRWTNNAADKLSETIHSFRVIEDLIRGNNK